MRLTLEGAQGGPCLKEGLQQVLVADAADSKVGGEAAPRKLIPECDQRPHDKIPITALPAGPEHVERRVRCKYACWDLGTAVHPNIALDMAEEERVQWIT